MANFKKDKTYRIGVLKPDADPNDPQPQFKQKPAPVTHLGSILLDYGLKDLKGYLESDQCQFTQDQTVTIYEMDDQGNMAFFGSANPLPQSSDEKKGLNDSKTLLFNPAKTDKSIPRELSKIYNQQSEYFQEQNKRLTAEVSMLRNRIMEIEREKIEIEGENTRLKIEKEVLEEKIAKYMDDKKEGLSDQGLGSVLGLAMEFASDPEIRSGIKEAAKNLLSKFTKKQPQQIQQGQQEQTQMNGNGQMHTFGEGIFKQ